MKNNNRITNREVLEEAEGCVSEYLEFASSMADEAGMIEKQILEVYKNPQQKLLNAWMKEPASDELLYWKERTVENIRVDDIIDAFASIQEAISNDQDNHLPYQVMISQAVSFNRKPGNTKRANCRRLQRGRNR